MFVALQVAAMRGVDVEACSPEPLATTASLSTPGRSFYEQLLEAGVHIHEYTPGMIHAKTMVVDGRIVLVGSANMDMRSFRLNFEVHTLLHDERTARGLESRFLADLAQTTPVTLGSWSNRPFHWRIAEGAGRLVSPLL